MYTLLYLNCITNNHLLNSTENSAQCQVAAWVGGEFGGEWIHGHVCLSPFPVHLKLLQHCLWAISSVQSLSRVRLVATPWTAACQASLFITNSQSLLKRMSIVSVMPSNHLILCRPLLLPPSIFPSFRVFSNESVLHISWPKYWSFSFSISPSNEHPGLVAFRMDWLDLLEVQGTQESFPTPQFKSINSLVLSFLHSPTLTSIHDPWKNHSFD